MRPLAIAIVAIFALSACESIESTNTSQVQDDGDPPVLPPATKGPYLRVGMPACNTTDPAPAPPIMDLELSTLDGQDDPEEVRWTLLNTNRFNDSWDEALDYLRNNPSAHEWSAWTAYDPEIGIGKAWRSPPMDFGGYVFAAHGRNAYGESSDSFEFGRNAMRIRVSSRSVGPILEITSNISEPIIAGTYATPATELNTSAGALLEFCWTADASRYCGTVTGYRYGWDVIGWDVGWGQVDDAEWQVGWTPYTGEACVRLMFPAGVHNLVVEVRDNNGFRTRVPIVLHVTN
jgi:hypothetical protein